MYNKFAQLLEERGITAYRVAKETGLNSTVFTDWKNGKSKPKVDKLKILADYFGVPIDYFLEWGDVCTKSGLFYRWLDAFF